ncbi:MAG: methylaspartate ammonia-lyase [Bdellovibrionales bacterium]|nr:methylaspartate ammonia-lyase [Bdellovibrionales bacterium]
MRFSIQHVLAVPGLGAYYNEDLAGLQQTPMAPSLRYTAPARTAGLERMRQVAEVLSVGLQVQTHGIFWGDAVGVSYAGKSGREGVFRAGAASVGILQTRVGELGRDFVDDCERLSEWGISKAFEYGVSQALLRAHAAVAGKSLTQFLCERYSRPLPTQSVPLHGSCGYDWEDNVDKMVFYRLASLPAGEGDDLPHRLGKNGEKLLSYVGWLKERVALQEGYVPVFHFDVHGGLDLVFDGDRDRILEFLCRLAEACSPFRVRVESPLQATSREEMLQSYRTLHDALRKGPVELVADEWANTLDDIKVFAEAGVVDMIHIKMPDLGSVHNTIRAIETCQKNAVASLLGGSCVETYMSSSIAAPIALALRPTLLMAKSGMGVNEAVSSLNNEMLRELALL